MAVEITGIVSGIVNFPEHPTHEGHLGLQGGEDVFAGREFRSVGAAMTWCRSVLDGRVKPRRIDSDGELLTPRSDPIWTTARVVWDDPTARFEVDDEDPEQSWVTGEGRGWYEELGDWRTATEPARAFSRSHLPGSTNMNDVVWVRRADAVAEFHTANDRWPFRGSTDPAEAKLGNWLSRNRAQARKGEFAHLLTRPRLAYMDAIAPGWRNDYEQNWRVDADLLARFRAEFGRWPKRAARGSEETRLHQWLDNQRSSTASSQRICAYGRAAYLDRVAPGWRGVIFRTWQENLVDMVAFRAETGSSPSAASADRDERRLAAWHLSNRTAARGIGDRAHLMTAARRVQLDEALPGWSADHPPGRPPRTRVDAGCFR